MTENTEVATVTAAQNGVAMAGQSRFTPEQIQENHITDDMQLPRLLDAKVSPMPIDVSYLKVKDMTQGDFINGFVWGIFSTTIVDPRTGEMKELPCLFFLQEKNDGSYEKVQTASKALVGKVETMIKNGEIFPKNRACPVRIVYDGIKTGAKNDYASWRIFPIILE